MCLHLWYQKSDINDPYAMSVMTGREVVGHVPYKISRMSVTNGRNVKCTSCNRKPLLFSDESFKLYYKYLNYS